MLCCVKPATRLWQRTLAHFLFFFKCCIFFCPRVNIERLMKSNRDKPLHIAVRSVEAECFGYSTDLEWVI